MNYRHAYHAGNFADVVKHALLTLVIAHLKRKETPFGVIDTHAGVGCYDLTGIEASKTGEFREGIARLLRPGDPSPLLEAYLASVKAINPDWPTLRFYPGSPWIARFHLRPIDRLTAIELHPEDARALKRQFARDRQVSVVADDAYAALKALVPPKERRGFVLIDPPFEARDEFNRIFTGLTEALRRWPTGIYGVWYPIKAGEPVARFLAEVAAPGRPCLTAELLRYPADNPDRLNGCGMVVINPPWKLDEALADLLPILADRLDARGGTSVKWLVEAT